MTNTDTIDTLNDLIETCKDGEYGFRTSGENARSAELRQLFMRRSAECGQAARDLQTQVAGQGLPTEARLQVERQLQGDTRNHAEVRRLRDQALNTGPRTWPAARARCVCTAAC